MKNKSIHIALISLMALFLSGCESTDIGLRQTGFYIGGYKATMKVIEKDPDNREVVVFIDNTFDAVLKKESILFESIEPWFENEWARIKMDPIEKEILRQAVIKPLYNRLKKKYNGFALDLQDWRVRGDIEAFQRGMKLAL